MAVFKCKICRELKEGVNKPLKCPKCGAKSKMHNKETGFCACK